MQIRSLRTLSLGPVIFVRPNPGCYNAGNLWRAALIELNVPGRGTIQLRHLVCDVHGTIALDGRLIEGVARALAALRDRLELHLLTADTHRTRQAIETRLGIQATLISRGEEAEAKAAQVRALGADQVVAIGQGANDAGMLREAAIGIALLSKEGLAVETLQAADLVVENIHAALDLLENPLRLVATLRR